MSVLLRYSRCCFPPAPIPTGLDSPAGHSYYLRVKEAAEFAIRDAVVGDATAIAEIYNHAVLNSTATFDIEIHTEERRAEWLKSQGTAYPVLVAENNSNLIGWASLGRWSEKLAYHSSVEISLYVHPEFTGRGIGTALTQAILDAGRSAGFHTVMARIADGNDGSRKLCHHFGFTYMGVMQQAGRKFDRWIDVHYYQLLLEGEGG